MFGFFDSVEKKTRATARNWLDVAAKVWRYRRDQLTETQAGELRQKTDALRQLLAARADAGKLKLGIESLEGALRRTGGRIYPKTSLVENVEFFLVAAILVFGFQFYFIRTFKIPTNSMWPTYYGMTGEVFHTPQEEPGLLARAGRFLAFGAVHYRLNSPASGEVKVLVFGNGRLAYTEKEGRKWFVFPALKHDYTFAVGGETATISLPADFDFDMVVQDAFGRPGENLQTELLRELRTDAPDATTVVVKNGDSANPEMAAAYWLPLGRTAAQGGRMLSFAILTGDCLFVDRFSYNFVRPKVGQGFVFRTDHLTELHRILGQVVDQYYIKRLVGVPGDRLEIRAPVLYRNGAPITGAPSFAQEARQAGDYPGYRNSSLGGPGLQLFLPGNVVTVPPHSYLAMGDNSPNSLDGRYWGFVPAKDVVGTPLFIYYPFTRRWGVAK